MPEDYLVADRTYPAYYYPLIWFLNNPEEHEFALRKVTLRAFWVHLELTEEANRSRFEKELSEMVPEPEALWNRMKSEFSNWVKIESTSEVKAAAIDRALFVGALASFYRPEDMA